MRQNLIDTYLPIIDDAEKWAIAQAWDNP